MLNCEKYTDLAGGGKEKINKNYYLYKGFEYATMTSSLYDISASVLAVRLDGGLTTTIANNYTALVPVINLSADAARTLVATTVDGKTIYSLP